MILAIFVLLILNLFDPTLSCMATQNSASATLSCANPTVAAPANDDVPEATLSVSGTTLTVTCQAEVQGQTAVVGYNAALNSGETSIQMTCFADGWQYTNAAGDVVTVTAVECLAG
ncbi:C6 domain-containing protein [Caenorhabditis elegans]|uniref:C6 domain-containing protein n=2 Tax=Caenorhabditis elegans TaxID=6239 RepID=U4PAN2_CAEEL|nr:C6 domain-containing protein [Caenorhabditis elegans]CDH92954.1 C6 domain-containing protein [Caenorhabditis elegans]|eukprot:NP_001294260.1 Uncharacterized protein CELE_Y54G2A.28 [Caenorhabditis elegans]